MRIRGVLALSGLPVAVALAVAGGRYAARRFTTPAPVEERFLTPWELGISYEEVSFVTEDGLRLDGWWLAAPGAERTVVALAGHNSARQHVLGISGSLWRAGANVLLFDNRGRGTSEGERISLGYYERLDAEAAIDYALARAPEAPLGVIGYSMGGSVALMVTASDERVGAVVCDSAFASQRDLLLHHARRLLGPPGPAIVGLARHFLHYDLRDFEPIKVVAGISPRPILFIHGENDEVTNPEDSRRMYEEAAEPKELWMVEGASHVESYFRDRAGYCSRVGEFFERYL